MPEYSELQRVGTFGSMVVYATTDDSIVPKHEIAIRKVSVKYDGEVILVRSEALELLQEGQVDTVCRRCTDQLIAGQLGGALVANSNRMDKDDLAVLESLKEDGYYH